MRYISKFVIQNILNMAYQFTVGVHVWIHKYN